MNYLNEPLYIEDYDNLGNLIHKKRFDGYEEWWKYNKKGNLMYYKNSNGLLITHHIKNGLNMINYRINKD